MVTKDGIKIAKEIDLVDLVESLGFKLKKLGQDTYAWQEHESFRISRYKGFYWHSKGYGGDSISCVQEMCGCNFSKAMELILGKSKSNFKKVESIKVKEDSKLKEKSEFHLPKKAENGKRAFAYLVKTRGINVELLKEEFRKGHIYQEAKTGNAVFVGYKDKKAVSAILRGVGEERFVKNQEMSDFDYTYRIGDKAESLYIFESAIDVLSYISMYHMDEEASYISLNGLSTKAMDRFIKDNPNCKTIVVCTDNDEAGEGVYKRLAKRKDMNQLILRERPKRKDFNEDLLSRTKGKGMSL